MFDYYKIIKEKIPDTFTQQPEVGSWDFCSAAVGSPVGPKGSKQRGTKLYVRRTK
jgi:hypothetical protein